MAMREQDYKLVCPTCGKKVDFRRRAENPSFPFCRERCRLTDLSKWFNEEHKIVGPAPEGQEEANGNGDEAAEKD